MTLNDFCNKINFTFGLPLIVLDFIDNVTGSEFIKELHEYMNPPKDIERFDTQAFYYRNMKDNIDEKFRWNIFMIFNALGNVNLNKYQNLSVSEKESIQYISIDSLKRNMPIIFGIKNAFFAECLFLYLSKNAPMDHKINYKQFMEQFLVFWPKKEKIYFNETKEARMWRETQQKMMQDNLYR